jgi:hypothetical protein
MQPQANVQGEIWATGQQLRTISLTALQNEQASSKRHHLVSKVRRHMSGSLNLDSRYLEQRQVNERYLLLRHKHDKDL